MSSRSRRLVIVATLLAVAALATWLPPLWEGGLPTNAVAVSPDRYLFIADTYGYAQTPDQSIVASPYDLRLRGSLATFPRQLGDWHGQDVASNDTALLGFRAEQHIFRDYHRGSGGALWLRLLASSDWKLFYHTPLICYQGSGWQVEPEATYSLPIGEGLHMRGFVARLNGVSHLVLYTFLWPSRYRDMNEGATMVELAVPFSDDREAAFREASDFLRLLFADGPGQVLPSPPAMQHTVRANLENKVMLLGYDLDRTFIKRGEKLRIALYWQTLAEMADDYTIFVHLLNPAGGDPKTRVLTQRDAQPYGGLYPTSRWKVDEIIKEVYELSIPRDAAAGNRDLEVGMYLPSTQRRLGVMDAAGRPMSDSVVLSPVRIGE